MGSRAPRPRQAPSNAQQDPPAAGHCAPSSAILSGVSELDPTQDRPSVSSAPPTGAMAKMSSAERKKLEKSHPWRDNIEAVAVAIATIVLFKYFVVEAYKIPTGSMQPTLMGNSETGIYDRVIVDKFSYHFRDPDRFEIAVFNYPLDSSKNFIKRIIGMPGEELEIRGGDPWIRPDGEAEFEILRRPRSIQDAQLRRLDTAGEWKMSTGTAGRWKITPESSGDQFTATGRGEATFPRTYESIRDNYVDGYPEGIKDDINTRKKGSNFNDVSDLRARCEIKADSACREVAIELHEGRRRFKFLLPGPTAPAGERARIVATNLSLADPEELLEARVIDGAVRLLAGETVEVEVENLNDRLALRIDGEEVASLEVPAAPDRARSKVTLRIEAPEGSQTLVEDMRVWRDIYYTFDPTRQKISRWTIPEGNYVVLGDNSQDSSDGRDWTLVEFKIEEGERAGETISGNLRDSMSPRPDSNPMYFPKKRKWEQLVLRDSLGERHVFERGEVTRLADKEAPLVPRDLIRGRAVAVVWPLAPQQDVYRWKWVR